MRCTVGLMLATITIVACSGSDAEPPPLETTPAITSAPTSEAPPTTDTTTESTDAPVTSAATTIPAPTTSIDEAAILAQAEAAYFEAWQVRTEALRNPTLPENELRLQEHYTGPNLEAALNDLRLSSEGGLIFRRDESAPSFAAIAESAEFVDDVAQDAVEIVVCEFNSDLLFEIGTAPDGGDVLVRDDPVTFLNVVRMSLEGDVWKLESGTEFEAVRDEEERCSDLD